MRKRWIIISSIILIIFSAIIFFLQRKSSRGIEVKTADVKVGDIVAYISASGSVESKNRKEYYASASAKVLKVNFKAGDRVKKGDRIIELDVPDLTAQLKTADAAYENAKIQLESLKKQRDAIKNGQIPYTGTTSQISIDDQIKIQENQVEIARLNLKQITENIAEQERYIESDINGIITSLNASEGSFTGPGMQLPLVVVEDSSKLQINTNVSEYDASSIKKGQDVNIRFQDLIFKGKVESISPSAVKTMSEMGGDTAVKVLIDLAENDGTLKIGYDVDADIITGRKKNVLQIPPEAVITDKEGNERVYIIEKGRAKLRNIKTGLSSDVSVEIISGLNTGDRVILNPTAALRDGARVTETGR